MHTEDWKPVPGFPGYEVSDLGRLRSFRRRTPTGHIMRGRTQRSNGQGKRGTSYVRRVVNLWLDGRRVTHSVHTLVLAAHVGPRPTGQEARHLNGDPLDNRLANLAWGSKSENALDTVAHGHHPMQQVGA